MLNPSTASISSGPRTKPGQASARSKSSQVARCGAKVLVSCWNPPTAIRAIRHTSRLKRRLKRFQPGDFVDCGRTGCRSLGSLDHKVIVEEFSVIFMLMEMLRRQHRGNDRHPGLELNVHQPADHCIGDEFMAINAAIDDETGTDNRNVAPAS